MKNILIVDDDEAFLKVLGSTLAESGYTVHSTVNGDLAQFISKLRAFDLVITDVNMPLIGGIEILQYYKQKFDIPVIIMSGNSWTLYNEKHFTDKGADGYIAKPFNKDQILNMIEAVIHKYHLIPKNKKIG